MSSMIFFETTTIASVLGSVIPSVIGLALYFFNFFMKLKQKGWRNLNEKDWRELGEQIEREFHLVSSSLAAAKEHQCCEHCQKNSAKLDQSVREVDDQINKSRSNLLNRANTKVAENLVPEKTSKG